MTSLMKEYGDDAAAVGRLRPLAAIPRMPRQLSSNRMVRPPADMRGFKVRVPETQMWLKTFQRFGASPTPMAWPEVFAALKAGVIDGQENPAALSFNSGIFDVNKNLALTEHMMQDNMIVMAEAAFQRLSEDNKKAVLQASRDMEDDIRKKVIADDAATFEKIKAKGITITEVDKEAFRAAIRGMDAEFPHVKKWVDRIAQIA
jgi:TRAP-type C4-dicarboxylate transport system substrate-binding protein